MLRPAGARQPSRCWLSAHQCRACDFACTNALVHAKAHALCLFPSHQDVAAIRIVMCVGFDTAVVDTVFAARSNFETHTLVPAYCVMY